MERDLKEIDDKITELKRAIHYPLNDNYDFDHELRIMSYIEACDDGRLSEIYEFLKDKLFKKYEMYKKYNNKKEQCSLFL